MRTRIAASMLLVAYASVLTRVMVFKEVPLIRVGRLMLSFGGTEAGRPANLVPFSTIVPYLFGHKGLIIAGINLGGNVGLLVPVGVLLPLAFGSLGWRKALVAAIASGLVIETAQAVLRIGIFDIDDVILNAAGIMLGYGLFVLAARLLGSDRR